MTPAQALTRTRTQLGETTAAFWSDAEIYGYLWEAECILTGKLGLNQATSSHTTVTGTSTYTFPDSLLRVERLTYNGKKLKKASFTDRDYLDGTDYGSTADTGNPEMYTEWAQQVYLYPVPDAAQTLGWFFYKAPAEITTASTVFTIKDEAIQQMIPDYAVWKCSLKDQEISRAERHKQSWEQNVLRAESMWSDKHQSDRISGVKDEDEYPGGFLGMD